MLDMYDFENDIWLCHSLRGQCFNFTAFVFSMILLHLFSFLIYHYSYVGQFSNMCIVFFSATCN